MVVGRDLELVRRPVLDGHLDAALALVGVPDAVVKAELHLLIDVAGEVVRRHQLVWMSKAPHGVGVGVHD